MELRITYNHNADDIQETILVNGRTIASITGNMMNFDSNTLKKIIELFRNMRKRKIPINSEMIAQSIFENYMDDEGEVIVICLLAGAKAYNSSSDVRTVTVQMILESENGVSNSIEAFSNCPYIKEKFKDNPVIINIITLMTAGLILAAFAETQDVLDKFKSNNQICSLFEKIIIN